MSHFTDPLAGERFEREAARLSEATATMRRNIAEAFEQGGIYSREDYERLLSSVTLYERGTLALLREIYEQR